MEERKRNTWIIVVVVVIAVLALLCCCLLAIGAIAAVFTTMPAGRDIGLSQIAESSEQVFIVETAPLLTVDSFAGDITVRSGPSGQLGVRVTKRAMGSSGLDRINVDVIKRDNHVEVRATHSGGLADSTSVDVEVTVPDDAQLQLHTNAGTVRVTEVQGEIAARTGAGNVQVNGAAGPVDLDTGAGDVDYAGEPIDRCTFRTGAGNITLRLPEDTSAQVQLNTGIGNIRLGGFEVEGEVGSTEVEGVIGTGEDAIIEARSGVGNIDLVQR